VASKTWLLLLTSICAMAMLGTAQAQPAKSPTAAASGFPQINCSRLKCSLDYNSPTGATIQAKQAASSSSMSTPTNIAPPPGQRFSWGGAGNSTCFDMTSGSYGFANPYPYIEADSIPVPLGSSYASIMASMGVSLSGGPSGGIATVGFLQIRASPGGTWVNLDNAYALTQAGSAASIPIYSKATYQGLSNLTSLTGNNTVPNLVDVRLAVFNLILPGFTNITSNQVCYATMELTF